MSALRFDVDLEWRADQIVGEITVGGVRTTVSEPRLMGGTGVGMSPEDLFVAAAASSYSVTLAEMLRAAGLPQSCLEIHAEGLVASDPGAVKFTTVTVRPTIHGADAGQHQAYEKAAIATRVSLAGRSAATSPTSSARSLSSNPPSELSKLATPALSC
jgi:peroxiredoxin-like protein